MYYLLGKETTLDNIKLLSSISGLHENPELAYSQFLLKNSVFEKEIFSKNTVIGNYNLLSDFAPSFSRLKSSYFSKNSKILENRINEGFFNDAMNQLNMIDCNIHELANYLIRLVIVNHLKSYTNGTLEDTIGLSIMNFKDEFNQQDFIELIVHQLVHMSLFLDDFHHHHMNAQDKEIMIDTNLIYIHGGNKFPAYIAYHSYIVGVEMLLFRSASKNIGFNGNYHGNTNRILRVTKSFEESILKNISLFLDRGRYIFDVAQSNLANFI